MDAALRTSSCIFTELEKMKKSQVAATSFEIVHAKNPICMYSKRKRKLYKRQFCILITRTRTNSGVQILNYKRKKCKIIKMQKIITCKKHK